MISEDQLREKLRKIEALYAGAKTDGEKSAAGAAAERIRVKFENASKQERAEEFKFRSEEHTSELQSLMRISYAVFCLKKNTDKQSIYDKYKFTITHYTA